MSKDATSPERALSLVPAVAPGVEVRRNDAGLAEIRIPRPRTRWIRFLCFIFRLPDHKILVLDETGTRMIGLVDGRRTFRELAEALASSESLDAPRARRSMAAFLERLADERVVSFSRAVREGGSGG